MGFKEFLNVTINDINEGAGNLTGLPAIFIKEITHSNLGGENSEINLYKKNAKIKDLTDACKLVGGFVASKDRGYRSYSRAELKAKADKEANAAVIVKINSEWAFLAKWEDYGEGNKKFQLITLDGVKTVRDTWVNRTRYGVSYKDYNRKYFSASEIAEIINFKDDEVDVYLVTTDIERLLKRQERESQKFINKSISPEKKKAIIKFLDSRSNGMIDAVKADLSKSIDKLNKLVELTIKRAVTGEDVKSDETYETIITELRSNLKEVDTIGYYIKEIVKDGSIKDNYYKDRNSYAFDKFMELVKTYKEENI